MKNFKISKLLLLLFVSCQFAQAQEKSFISKNDVPWGFIAPKNHLVYVIAHRGAHQGIPENSLAAYQKAIDLGCDFVEIDVRTTRDGKFVSIHNDKIDAYTEGIKGRVQDFTLAELRKLDIGKRVGPEWKNTRIPTFEEIVQLCQGKVGIYLDLKDAPVPELMNLIRKYNMEQHVVWYIPASYLNQIEHVNEAFGRSFLMPDPGPEKNIEALLKQVRVSVIASDMDQLTPKFMEIAHQHHVMVFADDKAATKAEWKQMLDWGVDGIQTDRPEELISFFAKLLF